MYQHFCELGRRLPKATHHLSKSTRHLNIVLDKDKTRQMRLCEQCYTYVRERMVTRDEPPKKQVAKEKPVATLLLSAEGWHHILEKNCLPRQYLLNLRILTMHEIGESRVLGLFAQGAYWLLFLDYGLLVPLKGIRNDAVLDWWSGDIAEYWGATLGL